MTSSYPFQADIRKYRIGGWESAKVSAKVNGKWVYLYNSENNKLLNCPELIRFERKYVPPSDTSDISTARKRPISVYDDVDRTITNEVRAPLQYKSTKKKKKFLSPVVYGSFYNQFRNTSTNCHFIFVFGCFAKPKKKKKKKKNYDIQCVCKENTLFTS